MGAAELADDLDSWEGHLRWLDKWYPASIFGGPGDVPKNPLDTGRQNVILTRALAAEKARADEAVERAEKAEAERDKAVEFWRRVSDESVVCPPRLGDNTTQGEALGLLHILTQADLAGRTGGER